MSEFQFTDKIKYLSVLRKFSVSGEKKVFLFFLTPIIYCTIFFHKTEGLSLHLRSHTH